MTKKTLIEFPCHFPIKIIGSKTDAFVSEIKQIVHKHFSTIDLEMLSQQTSKNGNYLSFTVTVYAESQEMLDEFYKEVSKHPESEDGSIMITRQLGIQPYQQIWQQMKDFTATRDEQTSDELWLLQHFPVYTQGQAGKPEHVLNPNSIPVIQSDRGGQVTYHGPGQLIAYILIDIQRRSLGIRTLVCQIEQILIKVLDKYQIKANTQCGAPGVYVENKKIASIGLRVKNGCTYHGIALNVDMDLTPFAGINPCGFATMKMTQISDYHSPIDIEQVSHNFIDVFLTQFNQ